MVDDEEVDSTMIGTYVANESKVLTTPGYTQHILNMFRNDELIVFVGGPRRVRPPSDAVLQRCLGRMRAWVKLSLQVVQTEFPCYNIFASFGVFALGKRGGSAAAMQEGDALESSFAACNFEVPNFSGQVSLHKYQWYNNM